MATTSGTVAATTVDVNTFVEHAFRRCGKMPSTVSGEQLAAARGSLFFLLTDLVNDGINLWCVNKFVAPALQGISQYALPLGTSDVLGANFRTYNTLTGTPLSGAGYLGEQFAVAESPTNVQVAFTVAGTPTLVVESSLDGVTWGQVAAFAVPQATVAAGQPLAQDIDNSAPAAYWRVRDASGTLLAGATAVFSNTPAEIPMSDYNRDDYFSLPNKTFQANRSLQYRFEKTLNPYVIVWPVPNTAAAQFAFLLHHQPQDVGSLTNLLDVPQRWYEYVLFAFACKVALELPAGELPPGRLDYLEAKAAEHNRRASNNETDNSPTRLMPNLRGYTR